MQRLRLLVVFLLLFSQSDLVLANSKVEVWFLEPVNRSADYDFDLEQRNYVEQAILPLVRASDISKNLKIFIEEGDSVNASVLMSSQINIYSRLLFFGSTPFTLQALFAHELAHAANDHFLLFFEDAASQGVIAMLNFLAGLAVSVAMFANEETAELSHPVLLSSLISTKHNYMRGVLSSMRRGEEAADMAALKLMQKANLKTDGLGELFQYFDNLTPSLPGHLREWLTHPLAKDRIRSVEANKQDPLNSATLDPQFVEAKVARLEAQIAYETDLQQAMELARLSYLAKAATGNQHAWKSFVSGLEPSFAADYALVVGLVQQRKFSESLSLVKKLLVSKPNHPLARYQQGRILLGMEQPAAAEEVFYSLHNQQPEEIAFKIFLAQAYLAQPEHQEKQKKALLILESLTFGEKIDSQLAYSSWILLQRHHRQQQDDQRAAVALSAALFAEITRDLQILFTSSKEMNPRFVVLKVLNKLRFIERFLTSTLTKLDPDTPYGRKASSIKSKSVKLLKNLQRLAI